MLLGVMVPVLVRSQTMHAIDPSAALAAHLNCSLLQRVSLHICCTPGSVSAVLRQYFCSISSVYLQCIFSLSSSNKRRVTAGEGSVL